MLPLDGRFDGPGWSGPVRAQQASALAIDGTELGALGCWLTDARLGDAPPSTAFGDMPGRPGGIDRTLEGPTGAALPSRRRCEFDIATDCAAHERAPVRFALGRMLAREVEVLYAPLGAALRGRLSAGEWADSNGISACTLTLDAEPFALGEDKASTSTMTVEGSAWAEPAFDITVRAPRANVDLTLDGLRAMRVPSASGRFAKGTRIAIDSAEHTVKVNGELAYPTLDSDWPLLTPGAHTVACEGCDVTVAWRERYMF